MRVDRVKSTEAKKTRSLRMLRAQKITREQSTLRLPMLPEKTSMTTEENKSAQDFKTVDDPLRVKNHKAAEEHKNSNSVMISKAKLREEINMTTEEQRGAQVFNAGEEDHMVAEDHK